MSGPQVDLGFDQQQNGDTSHASTVESFFLQRGTSSTNADKMLEHVSFGSANGTASLAPPKNKKPSIYATKTDVFSVKHTLEVCQKLQGKVSGDQDGNGQSGDGVTSTRVIDLLLSDAVVCGYMEKFAQRTFCAENLAFVMAVEMYKAVWSHMNAAAKVKVDTNKLEKEKERILATSALTNATKATKATMATKGGGGNEGEGNGGSTGTPTNNDEGSFSTEDGQNGNRNDGPRSSTLSIRSKISTNSGKSSKSDSASHFITNLSSEFDKIPINQLGPRLVKRICEDAGKIWSLFIDDEGENQISVDHKSLVKLIANVWGPNPPSHVTLKSSCPDLSQIKSIGTNKDTYRLARKSSIAALYNISVYKPLNNVTEEREEGRVVQQASEFTAFLGKNTENETTEDSAKDSAEDAEDEEHGENSPRKWIPGPQAFEAGIKWAKRSLEHHVVPGFLQSPEWRVYQKRCQEINEIIKSSMALSNYPLSFQGTNGNTFPLAPTTTMLDNEKTVKSILNKTIVYTLESVLADRYLFETFLQYLKSRYCPETLLCYRSLQLFRLTYRDWSIAHKGKSGSPNENEDSPIEQLSWTVAVFFLSKGMPLEVPVKLSNTYTRHLSYKMASPAINMFAKVERACYEVIRRDLFPEFSASKHGSTNTLNAYMKDMINLHKKEKKGLKKNAAESSSCVVM